MEKNTTENETSSTNTVVAKASTQNVGGGMLISPAFNGADGDMVKNAELLALQRLDGTFYSNLYSSRNQNARVRYDKVASRMLFMSQILTVFFFLR